MDDLRMRGGVVLITGAAGHVGVAAAEAYASIGTDLILTDRLAGSIQDVAEALQTKYDVAVSSVAADLEDESSIARILSAARESFARLDVLVNCAAFVGASDLEGWATEFEHQSLATWRRALEVNLTAPFALVQAALPLLRASGRASVINVSSIYGLVGPDLRLYEGTGMGSPAAYAASKAGLIGLTRYLATILAPEIRVNAIAPGGIRREQPEEFVRRYEARAPMRRMGTEDDLKGAFLYLGSDLSRYVTGQVLEVSGGWTAW